MQSSSSPSTFAEVIASLAVLHQEQHRALLDLRTDQERRFQAIVQAQQEDRERFRSWIDREVHQETIGQPAAPTHLPLNKMGPSDDPEAFLDLFERSAEASGWPRDQWAMRLVPLLSGESQVAAQQLPAENLLVFDDLRRAIVQRVGRTPEQHRQRFRSLDLGESGRPFVLAQQLRDSCRKWLLAEGSDVDRIIDRVVLEQFITRLPKKTAEWVQCHRPTSLDSAIELAEDHMVACQGVGEPLPSASLSPSFNSPSLSKPVPLPRSRPPGPPRVPPRGRGGTEQGPYYGPRAPPRGAGLPAAGPDSAPASPLSSRVQ
ncbi:neurotrophin receptor-interacting factor homolog [Chanodichthys erythropterus]|uniref:neurotrophin receptor-interacting factor homolog n=1 Tax=Chanodichthys erythropterus TaxID=933992 RepID=UPI00351E474C